MKATVEPLPLVPPTVMTFFAGRFRRRRLATSPMRSRPMSMVLGWMRSMYSSQSASVRVIAALSPVRLSGRRLQGPMHRFAEQQRVVAAIVEAHHFEMVDVRAFQQVDGGGRLAEAPQLRQRDA